MSTCIVCNKQIRDGAYFCTDCLREQIGDPPKRQGPSFWLLLTFSPFHAADFNFHTNWQNDDDKRQWVAQGVDVITVRFPQIPIIPMVDVMCTLVGLEPDANRPFVLEWLDVIRANKDAPLWAPWDIVLQPGFQSLILAIAVLGLFMLVRIG